MSLFDASEAIPLSGSFCIIIFLGSISILHIFLCLHNPTLDLYIFLQLLHAQLHLLLLSLHLLLHSLLLCFVDDVCLSKSLFLEHQ